MSNENKLSFVVSWLQAYNVDALLCLPNSLILMKTFLRTFQFTHYKEEMLQTAQRAFGISSERHYRLLHTASEEKPKTVVLSVIVQEAEGLEAKDANGECKM